MRIRWMVLVLVLALATVMLAGCGGTETAERDIEQNRPRHQPRQPPSRVAVRRFPAPCLTQLLKVLP
jgi:hypothetical protein